MGGEDGPPSLRAWLHSSGSPAVPTWCRSRQHLGGREGTSYHEGFSRAGLWTRCRDRECLGGPLREGKETATIPERLSLACWTQQVAACSGPIRMTPLSLKGALCWRQVTSYKEGLSQECPGSLVFAPQALAGLNPSPPPLRPSPQSCFVRCFAHPDATDPFTPLQDEGPADVPSPAPSPRLLPW